MKHDWLLSKKIDISTNNKREGKPLLLLKQTQTFPDKQQDIPLQKVQAKNLYLVRELRMCQTL